MEDLPRLTRAELAELDRIASEEYGLPIAVLMENAGRSAAEEILRLWREALTEGKGRGPVVVLVGPGNNGGDACVALRHLANAAVPVEAFAVGSSRAPRSSRANGAADDMRRAVERMGIAVEDASAAAGLGRLSASLARASVIVDGLLGTGFRGEVRPEMARLIEATNAARRTSGAIVVALDLPSGLDADTGRAADPTVVADWTVTFAAWKVGFDAPGARACLGRVVVGTIGAPAALVGRVSGDRGQPGRVGPAGGAACGRRGASPGPDKGRS